DKAWQVDLDEEANERGIHVLWIQVNDLLASLMFERMVKQVGDFLGQFLDYDAKPISLNGEGLQLGNMEKSISGNEEDGQNNIQGV
ncbi:hypothetical protein Gorai_019687, partial [Gossypium raimondii]|nr:hypothetical protein [Gossypium raimondii]